MRACEGCGGSLDGLRKDARYCSRPCRRQHRPQVLTDEQKAEKNARSRRRWADDEEYRQRLNRSNRLYRMRTLYGLTEEDVDRFDRTTVCENPGCTNPPEHVDHSHETGAVRGFLCHGCNTSLGLLGEDPARIAGLITYLQKD